MLGAAKPRPEPAPVPSAADLAGPTTVVEQVEESRYRVSRQEVDIEINFRERTASGTSHIYIVASEPGATLKHVALDARQCEIDLENITVDGIKAKASFSDPYDQMLVPPHWQINVLQYHVMLKRMCPLLRKRLCDVPISKRSGCVPLDGELKVQIPASEPQRRSTIIKMVKSLKTDRPAEKPDGGDDPKEIKISIPFRSKPICDSLHFVGVDEGDTRYPHVYTRLSMEPGTASCLFPCVDDPGTRTSWKLNIKCPRTMADAMEQPLATQPTATAVVGDARKRKHGEEAPARPLTILAEEDKVREMTVVCSGNLAGEQIDPANNKKKILTFECNETAAHNLAFAIGPFEHVDLWSEFRTEESDEKLGGSAAKIHAYFLPDRRDQVLHTCEPIVAAADYFAPEFGKYPFDSYKMVFVEDMISDTAVATSMSLCSTRLLYPSMIIDTELEVTRKLVHALASQYFGTNIVADLPSDTWLVVGLQWYMADLFMKTICGNNWYRFHLKTMADKLVETDVDRPSLHNLSQQLHVGDFELEFMSLKAPLVLFILDQRMAKNPAAVGLARVVSAMVTSANIDMLNPSARVISAEKLRKSCEKKSQYRVDAFWKEWVEGAGCVKFFFKQKFNKKNLNVDILVDQSQGAQAQGDSSSKRGEISKTEFWREFLEDRNHVYAGDVSKRFTGPMTVRTHEADGTPYEHYLDVREDDGNRHGATWSIPYNTKYKRVKRTKRSQAVTSSADRHDLEDDIIYFNMLGDVLQAPEDIDNWGLQTWPDKIQQQMGEESYEWIRFDCNFEWIGETLSDMPGYMYLAQLQQDRDVVAHQDAMLYFKRGRRHGVAATIMTRTLMDRRYYHGIRTMAVEELPKHASDDLNYIGLAQLVLSFRHFFCYRMDTKTGVSYPPAPNDFSDKAQYAVQCAIPLAVARTRHKGRCSKEARSFLLDLILFNDNSENVYSDQIYIARLLEALTTSLIPEAPPADGTVLSNLKLGEEEDAEFARFLDRAIEEVEKYRRVDEWELSYQNIWTTTALECKMRLMKERVIPVAPLEFLQYLQDDNVDIVRIKAYECLVELGMLSKGPIMKLMLSAMSTDRSPFVRNRLFRAFCTGIAAIGLGETKATQPPPAPEIDESGLIVEGGEGHVEQNKLDALRREDINHTLGALKDELKGNSELKKAIWAAVCSPVIGLVEKRQLLELCGAMFEPDDALLVTLNLPKAPVVERVREPLAPDIQLVKFRGSHPPHKNGKRCVLKFSVRYRSEPRPGKLPQTTDQPSPPMPPPLLPTVQPLSTGPPGSAEVAPDAKSGEPPAKKSRIISLKTPASFNGALLSRKNSMSSGPLAQADAVVPLTGESASVVSTVPRVAATPFAGSPPAISRPVSRAGSTVSVPSTLPDLKPKVHTSPLPGSQKTTAAPRVEKKKPKGTTSSSKKRKPDDADLGVGGAVRPKKAQKKNSRIVTLKYNPEDMPIALLQKAREANAAATKLAAAATPTKQRTALPPLAPSSAASSRASPAASVGSTPAPSGGSNASNASNVGSQPPQPLSNGAARVEREGTPGSVKQRKPLPGSASAKGERKPLPGSAPRQAPNPAPAAAGAKPSPSTPRVGTPSTRKSASPAPAAPSAPSAKPEKPVKKTLIKIKTKPPAVQTPQAP